MPDIQVKLNVHLTKENIEDIICTALCGGINYWACLDNTKQEFEGMGKDDTVDAWTAKILLGGGSVTFIDEEDGTEYELTLDMLLNGIKLFVEKGYDRLACFTGEEVDLCNFDANDGDAVIQLAIFNGIVFG